MRNFKKIRIYLIGLPLVLFFIILASNLWVVYSTKRFIIKNDEDIEKEYKLAVVLGTSHRNGRGGHNSYFDARIRTAARLYHKKIVTRILVSGSNPSIHYNEPVQMQAALVALKVSQADIILDAQGSRTYSSIVRTHKIFGYSKFVIVTQEFHCYRALYISHYYGLEPVAIAAHDYGKWGSAVHLREYFARVKVVFELYLRDVRLI